MFYKFLSTFRKNVFFFVILRVFKQKYVCIVKKKKKDFYIVEHFQISNTKKVCIDENPKTRFSDIKKAPKSNKSKQKKISSKKKCD